MENSSMGILNLTFILCVFSLIISMISYFVYDKYYNKESLSLTSIESDVKNQQHIIQQIQSKVTALEQNNLVPSDLSSRIDNIKTTTDSLVNDIKLIKEGSNQIVTDKYVKQEDLTKLNNDFIEFGKNIDSIKTQLKELKDTSIPVNITADVNDVSVLIDGIQKKYNGLESRISTNEESIYKLNQTFATMDTKVNNQNIAINGLLDSVGKNDAKITTNTTSINNLNTKYSAVDTKLTTNTNSIADLITKLTGIDTKLTTNTNSINDLSTKYSDVDIKLTTNTNSINDLGTKYSDVDTKLTTNTNSIADLITKLTGFDTKIGTNTSSINEMNTKLNGFDTKLATNATTMDELNTKYLGVDAKLKNVNNKLNIIDNRNEKLLPADYRNKGMGVYYEFKKNYHPNIPYYCVVQTIVPWNDISGDAITQQILFANNIYIRQGNAGDTAWNNWVSK